MIIILLAIGALAFWYMAANAKPEQAAPRYVRDSRLTPANPEWREVAEAHCESPAEWAFLKAMIDTCGLTPDGGSLRNTEIRLDFQVGQGRYRADFLANEWLVVEVDGAAYHSSPQQQARDRLRDEDFIGLGYAVLRLPARLVFRDPNEAVRRVRERLAQGRPVVSSESRPKPNLLTSLSSAASEFGAGVAKVNEHMTRQKAINEALKDQRAILDDARHALGLADQRIARKAKIDALCDTPEKRESYDRHYAKIEAALAQIKPSATPSKEPPRAAITRTMRRPDRNENAEYNALIQSAYEHILADYVKLIASAKAKMNEDHERKRFVLEALLDSNSSSLITELTSYPGRQRLISAPTSIFRQI